jgi:trk system potassium uptake protein
MYILIGGAGLVGLNLARELVDLGHTVAVIDPDPTACRYAREQVGAMAFEGSAVSTQVLLEAGIRRADAVVAALRNDALNLALVTLARHYGVSHVLTRMRQRDFEEPYRIAGAERVVSTIDLAVTTLVNAIEFPQVESIMHFEQDEIEVFKLAIPETSVVAGRTIADIVKDPRFPKGSLFIGYQSHPHEGLIVPNSNTIIEAGACILVVTQLDQLHCMLDYLSLPTNRPPTLEAVD